MTTTLHTPFEVISETALARLRVATNLPEKHKVLREVFNLDFRYPCSGEDASSNAMRQDILLELYSHLFTFCVGANLDDVKASVLFALVHDTHTWSCRSPAPVPCYEYFEALLLAHSVHRPPASMAVFSAADVQAVSSYFLENYVKFLPMYQYVFAVARDLVLDVRRSLAEPASLDRLVALDCAVAYAPAEACTPESGFSPAPSPLFAAPVGVAPAGAASASPAAAAAAPHPHDFILLLDTQETVARLCAAMPVAPRLAPPLAWSAPPAYPRPDPAPVVPVVTAAAGPFALPAVALPNGGALTGHSPSATAAVSASASASATSGPSGRPGSASAPALSPSTSSASAAAPAAAGVAVAIGATVPPYHPATANGVPVAPSADAAAARAHALLVQAGVAVQPPRAPLRFATGFPAYPARANVAQLLRPAPKPAAAPAVDPEQAAAAARDEARAAGDAAAAAAMVASPLAAALAFPVAVPVAAEVLTAHAELNAQDQALVGAALRRELAVLAGKFDAAARAQEAEYGRRIAALEEAAAQAQAQLAAAGVAAEAGGAAGQRGH